MIIKEYKSKRRYQGSNAHTEVQVIFDNDTVWLNQEQLGSLFS